MRVFYSIMIGLAIGLLIFSVPTAISLICIKNDVQSDYAGYALTYSLIATTSDDLYVTEDNPDGSLISNKDVYTRTFSRPTEQGFYKVVLTDISVPSISAFHKDIWPCFQSQPVTQHICSATQLNMSEQILKVVNNNIDCFTQTCFSIVIILLLQITLSLLLICSSLAGLQSCRKHLTF